MERITIRVNSKQEAQTVLNLLKTLDFVKDIQEDSEFWLDDQDDATEEEATDFFDLAGIWAGRDITQESLRKKAWPARS